MNLFSKVSLGCGLFLSLSGILLCLAGWGMGADTQALNGPIQWRIESFEHGSGWTQRHWNFDCDVD